MRGTLAQINRHRSEDDNHNAALLKSGGGVRRAPVCLPRDCAAPRRNHRLGPEGHEAALRSRSSVRCLPHAFSGRQQKLRLDGRRDDAQLVEISGSFALVAVHPGTFGASLTTSAGSGWMVAPGVGVPCKADSTTSGSEPVENFRVEGIGDQVGGEGVAAVLDGASFTDLDLSAGNPRERDLDVVNRHFLLPVSSSIISLKRRPRPDRVAGRDAC